jgi:very-short-patch-repair endonuclease
MRRASTSKGQRSVGQILNAHFSCLDVYEDFPVDGLYIDWFIPQIMLAVEVDGEQHDEFNKFFHKNGKGFAESIRRDERKAQFCELNNITLVRLDYKEAFDEDLVMTRIQNELERE